MTTPVTLCNQWQHVRISPLCCLNIMNKTNYKFNLYNAEIFLHKYINQRVFSIWNHHNLALSSSFEYLCYGSTIIRNILILSARGSSLYVRIWHLQTSDSDVYRPRAERVKESLAKVFYFSGTLVFLLILCSNKRRHQNRSRWKRRKKVGPIFTKKVGKSKTNSWKSRKN